MGKNYTTKTAALKATIIDTRTLDAKNIFVQPRGTDNQTRENILDIIDKSKTIVYDTRGENVTENDLWGRWIENTEDGKAILHDDFILLDNGLPLSDELYSISNNKAFNEQGEFLYNIECDKIIRHSGNGVYRNLTSFEGNLDNLYGSVIFFFASQIKKFQNCLPNLLLDLLSFADTKNLKTFSSSLDKLQVANGTFDGSGIESFSAYVPYLHDGYCMFRNSNIKEVDASFTNLLKGLGMFENTNLSIDSVRRLAETLPIVNNFTYNEEGDKVFSFEEGVQISIQSPFEGIEISDFIINKEDIGEITITWKDPSIFTEEEKAIIIHEYFGLMNAKGWTVITNLMEGEPDGIYVKARNLNLESENLDSLMVLLRFTHISTNGGSGGAILHSAPCVMRPTSGFSGTGWEKYATIEEAEAALNLMPYITPSN